MIVNRESDKTCSHAERITWNMILVIMIISAKSRIDFSIFDLPIYLIDRFLKSDFRSRILEAFITVISN